MNLTDANVKTTYLGDSVYVSEQSYDPTFISIFLNNGERESKDFIKRKHLIVLDPDVARRLVAYIQERLQII